MPAYDSVLVPFEPERIDPAAAERRLAQLVADVRARPLAVETGLMHRVPVRYGGAHGPDLEAVAERLGLTPAQVVEAHTAETYRVFMLGFAPGFGYLGPLPEALRLPRRDHPRSRVPAGSVAIAGSQTAVYPVATPGGWHLIGRTEAVIWDAHRAEPALLSPGDLSASNPCATDMLRVLEPGLLATVQDEGRPAAAHLGVPRSGACDTWSMRVANRLLANDAGAAVLEMTLLGATFEVTATGVIAIAGADMAARIVEEQRPLATGASHLVRAGTTLHFGSAARGVRTYLALPGGVDVEVVLGSRSTCLAGAFGGLDGRPLAAGRPTRRLRRSDGAESLAAVGRPVASTRPIPRPASWSSRCPMRRASTADALEALDRAARGSSPPSATGPACGSRASRCRRARTAEALVSAGVMPGAIQVPPSGLPIVLLADAPTVGGYPVPALVASAHLAIVAQRAPGELLHFVHVGADDARRAAATQRVALAGPITGS